MAINEAQHKIVNLLKTSFFFCSSVFISVCVFHVWPKTTLLPVWPRDVKMLDTPGPCCRLLLTPIKDVLYNLVFWEFGVMWADSRNLLAHNVKTAVPFG